MTTQKRLSFQTIYEISPRECAEFGSILLVDFGRQRARRLAEVSTREGWADVFRREVRWLAADLGEIEGTMVSRLRADVLLEMKDLEEQRTALRLAMSNARTVVGDIALASVRVVRDGLTAVVKRGDLGLIDVAWEAKERQTDEIGDLIKKQNEAIREVEAQFKSVLPR